MLKRNLGRLLLSFALTLSYAWTACQKKEMEARKIPSETKLEVRSLQKNQPILAEAFSETRQLPKN